MYAKHRLPLWVIIRGLISPLIKPLAKGQLDTEFIHGIAIARGRLSGWLHWLYTHTRHGKTPQNDTL
jgi:hypothetical protein